MSFRKISQEKVDRILELADQDLLPKDIADEVGVGRSTVVNYLAKTRGPVKRPELETSFLKVLALLEETLTLLQEQREKKAVVCPICRFPLYPSLNGEDVIWGCVRCGYRGISPEPEWKKIEEFEIGEKYER